MSDNPDVSVVMSVYNGARYLSETLASILAQEGVALELIVVNDGSTDRSGEILDDHRRRDPRIRVLDQNNRGLTHALIAGCAAARGKYIARHDVGDTSGPQRLAIQKQALDAEKGVALVSCWTEFCGPEWEFLYLVKGTGKAVTPTSIISESEKYGVVDGPTHHGSVMFDRGCYLKAGAYRAEFYYGQDWDLWYRLGESGKFQMIEQTLYRVRILADGISMTNKAGQTAVSDFSLAALRQRLRGLSEQPVLSQASAIRPQQGKSKANSSAAGLYFVGECLRQNGDGRALAYFKQSIRSSPFLMKAWIRILQHKLGGNRKKRVTELSTE